MPAEIYDDGVHRLFMAILSLKDEKECRTFFEDLATPEELAGFSKRLTAAEMIIDGCVYSEINEKTGLSTATISRVNRSLKYGDGGYELVLKRLEESESEKSDDK